VTSFHHIDVRMAESIARRHGLFIVESLDPQGPRRTSIPVWIVYRRGDRPGATPARLGKCASPGRLLKFVRRLTTTKAAA